MLNFALFLKSYFAFDPWLANEVHSEHLTLPQSAVVLCLSQVLGLNFAPVLGYFYFFEREIALCNRTEFYPSLGLFLCI